MIQNQSKNGQNQSKIEKRPWPKFWEFFLKKKGGSNFSNMALKINLRQKVRHELCTIFGVFYLMISKNVRKFVFDRSQKDFYNIIFHLEKGENMILSFSSLKGGVGKTTSCANLGFALAKHKRILIVDFDAQGGITHHLSSRCKKFKASLYDVLQRGFKVETAIHSYIENLDFIPTSYKFYELASIDFENKLQKVLNKLKSQYKIILFDLAPSIYPGTVIPLLLSDLVVIPVDCNGALSILGLQKTEKILEELIKEKKQSKLDLFGILPTFVERTQVCKEVLEFLHRNYSGYILKGIRRSTVIAQASGLGKTIFEHKATCNAAKDYAELAKEFLGRIEQRKGKKK
jgi:chromosome partitioning protein